MSRSTRILDSLTVGVLMVAPLVMGGRHPWGRLVYVGIVATMLLAWLLSSLHRGKIRYRSCGLEWGVLLATLLVVSQVVPLPTSVLAWLSPRLSTFLPLWNGESLPGTFGPWATLSLAPNETRIGFAVWLAHATFLFLMIQRLDTLRDARWLVGCVAMAGVFLSAIGMLQYLFSNGRFLWVYQNPFRDTREIVRGPFYNENHFAHFLTLTIVPLWVWLRARREERTARRNDFTIHAHRKDELLNLMLGLALPGILFTVLLTQSRGGMLVLLVAGVLGVLGMARRNDWGRKQLACLGGVAVLLAVGLSIHGLDQVRGEFESLATTSIERLDQQAGRRGIWRAARDVLGQFTLCGGGVGSFRETFPLFYSKPRQVNYSYAESGYLQVAAETGLLGIALLAYGLVYLTRRLIQFRHRSPKTDGWEYAMAAVVGIVISLAHSVFDFVWYLPACFAVTLALLAVLIRWTQGYEDRADAKLREISFCGNSGTIAITVVALMMLVVMRPVASSAFGSGAWNRYLLASETSATVTTETLDHKTLLKQRQCLLETVRSDRAHARAHLRLAAVNMRLFERYQQVSDNPMSLTQIRDAALASRFTSRQAQDQWLDVAIGSNRLLLEEALRHTTIGLRLSPLQGAGYVYLAELSFIASPGIEVHPQLIRQALRVRPYDPAVLFAAGREAIFAGDPIRAIPFWRRAYHQDQELRSLITAHLAPSIPADLFIEQFQPRTDSLLSLFEFYKSRRLDTQATTAGRALLDQFSRHSLDQPDNAHAWRQAYSVAAKLDDPRAVSIGRRAVQLDPYDYAMRRRLAFELLDRQDWSGAIKHLRWCLEENRTDQRVADKLDWARLQQRTHTVQQASLRVVVD